MDYCNGKTHTGSDDSYKQWSYPCPGPDKCPDARARLATEEAAINEVTEDEINEYFDLSEPEPAQSEIDARIAELTEQKRRLDEEAKKRFEALKAERHGIAGPGPCVLEPGREMVERFKPHQSTQDLIVEVCDEFRDFLVNKNEQYGDSAINPVRIFSKASPIEQLLVRIDDKISRIERGDDRLESDDDVLDDLIGYLLLLKIAKRRDR